MSYINLPSIVDQGTTVTIQNNIRNSTPTAYSKFVQVASSNVLVSTNGTSTSTLTQTPSGLTGDILNLQKQLTSLNATITGLLKSQSITDNGSIVNISTPLIAPNINFTGDYKYSEQVSNHIGSNGTWLICNGASFNPSTYPKLFALIGTRFGGSAGAPLLPNLQGRVLSMSGNGHGVGSYFGEDSHTLNTGEMPTHNHTDAGHSHIDAGHAHTTPWGEGFAAGQQNRGGLNFLYQPGTQTTGTQNGYANIQTNYANIQNTGGNGAHNNVQPTMYCQNIFIFAN